MTHHCYDVIITRQNLKFGNFSSDIDYNIVTDVFRDVIHLIINQYDPRRPKGASGRQIVSASCAAEANEARLKSLKEEFSSFKLTLHFWIS